jgi:hypothetical protein
MMGACPTTVGPALALGGLKAAGGLLGLLEILLAGAPEDDTARHAPHRERDVEFTGEEGARRPSRSPHEPCGCARR